VNRADPSGDSTNLESGPAISDGCTGANAAACTAAWNRTRADVKNLLTSEYPQTSWGSVFTDATIASLNGAAVGAGVGCLATLEVACAPGAIVGAISGAIGAFIGGFIGPLVDQTSYSATYVARSELAILNIIYVDVHPYIGAYIDPCSPYTPINHCVDSLFLSKTTIFLTAQAALGKLLGTSALLQADGRLANMLGKYTTLKSGVTAAMNGIQSSQSQLSATTFSARGLCRS